MFRLLQMSQMFLMFRMNRMVRIFSMFRMFQMFRMFRMKRMARIFRKFRMFQMFWMFPMFRTLQIFHISNVSHMSRMFDIQFILATKLIRPNSLLFQRAGSNQAARGVVLNRKLDMPITDYCNVGGLITKLCSMLKLIKGKTVSYMFFATIWYSLIIMKLGITSNLGISSRLSE